MLVTSQARGDFYRVQGEDGIEVFTNTPTSSGAVKIMKEDLPKKSAPPPKTRRKLQILKTDVRHSNTDYPPSQNNLSLLQLPVSGTISSNYGWRHDPIDGNLRHHSGIDIAVASGTPVKAIAPGTVTFSGARGGYGKLVVIEHDDGMVSLYGHNSVLLVNVGDVVDAQKPVALSGSTGRSTGPHLHFELWKGDMNLTQAYVEDRRVGFNNVKVAVNRVRHEEIRRFVEKNGTIVFTNLPQFP